MSVYLLCFDATGLLVCAVPQLHSAEHLNVVIYVSHLGKVPLCVPPHLIQSASLLT